MKNSIKFLVLTTMLGCVACTTNTLDEGIVGNDKLSRDLPSEITVSFYDEATSRIQLDNQCRTTWTEDDELSVFYFSDANNRFLFMGDTGDRNGALVVEDNRMGEATAEIDKVVLVYPYSDKYKLNASSKSIGITIPGTQYYLNGSYGVGANIMTSVGTTNDFSLKSVCGWIKVQLTGAASVTEVSLTGNNKEQLAGDATLYYEENRLALLGEEGGPDDNSQVGGTLFFGEYVRTITLDCGEGIALSSNTPTEFYFVLAPQTFDEGITIKATLSDGSTITKSTSKSITIERNVITPMAAFDVQPSNEIWYTSTDGEIVTPYLEGIDGFGANIVSNTYENGKGVITFDGDVTQIGDLAFYNCSSLASVTIPDSVTQIGNYAFLGCTSLTSITIPDGVTQIGEGVFSGCSSLSEFRGKYASEDGRCLIIGGTLNSFAPAGLTEYTIPDSVTEIGGMAFSNCTSLTSVTIPESVTVIGNAAFSCCTSLTSITIPDSVTSIGSEAFSNCTSLTNITIPDSVTQIGYYAFYDCSSLENVIIPNGVTEINSYVFNGCTSLTSISIPDSVTIIYDHAFAHCGSLTQVDLGQNVSTIMGWAFCNCIGLTTVTIPDSVVSMECGVFGACLGLERFEGKNVSADGRCLIFDGMIKAFAPAGLTEYAIPEGVTAIEMYTFQKLENLTAVSIPRGIERISEGLFEYCTGLTSFSTDDTDIKYIDKYAFQYCTGLVEVDIDNIDTMGYEVFRGCTSLTDVYCRTTTPPTAYMPYGWYAFDSNVSGFKIYVPTNSVDDYKAANGWRDYAEYIEGYEFLPANNEIWYTSTDGNIVEPSSEGVDGFGANIVSNTYENGKGVITFDGDVTKIGISTFSVSENLLTISLPNSVTEIEGGAFNSCRNLTSFTTPNSVTTIGVNVFGNCEKLSNFYGKFASQDGRCLIIDGVLYGFAPAGLTEYVIPDEVTSIKYMAFENCDKLTNITIPQGVTEIGSYAFTGCMSLTNIAIPEGVTTIGEGAFSFCGLTNVTLPESLVYETYCNSFIGCSDLMEFKGKYASDDGRCLVVENRLYSFASAELIEYTIPDNITAIGDGAFMYCSYLADITIPESITYIGQNAFFQSSLAKVYCKSTTPPRGWYNMFTNVSSIIHGGYFKIYIPTESVEAYQTAEGWSDYAEYIEPYNFEA